MRKIVLFQTLGFARSGSTNPFVAMCARHNLYVFDILYNLRTKLLIRILKNIFHCRISLYKNWLKIFCIIRKALRIIRLRYVKSEKYLPVFRAYFRFSNNLYRLSRGYRRTNGESMERFTIQIYWFSIAAIANK